MGGEGAGCAGIGTKQVGAKVLGVRAGLLNKRLGERSR
jgi:hypothetical protein